VVVAVKALACELPGTAGVPLARWHCPDLARTAIDQGIVASISGTTIWRWLSADAIKPWQHRSWIFPRDPDFAPKAARVLDLYGRRFDEYPLTDDEYVISADEKTSIQARARKRDTSPPAPGRPPRIEHEYARAGSLAYLAAWDVHHARLFGRAEPTTGIDAFDRLVDQVMTSAPYASAGRVFWIVDNGSSHRGQPSIDRLQSRWPTLRLIHLPIHASWLDQVEIYFSVVQRKVLAPNDFRKQRAATQTSC
jgi:DDE superfamily endonuclease